MTNTSAINYFPQLRSILVVALLSCMCTACDFQSLKDPILLTDVEDEFFLDMWEEITPQGRYFSFLIQTIDDQPCSNSTIEYEVAKSGINLDISLKRITQPSDCAEGLYPAIADINLGALPSQYFSVKIDLRDAVVNRAHFTVSEDAYLIDMQTEYGIKPLRSQLRRIEPQQCWGYISFPHELSDIARELDEKIRSIANYRLPTDGYYGYFTIANGNLALKGQPEDQALRTLVLDIAEDQKERLSSLVDEYRTRYADQGLEISFRDGKGQSY